MISIAGSPRSSITVNDVNGNAIVPLCYPYANGNCVHYEVYSGTPGTEPDPSLYTGGVNWQIAWNNDTFTPPAPYTGSQPQLYDDPDYAPTPTSAVGSVCTQPMTINGVNQSYSCQFEFDITTFFNATLPVDSVIGGTTKQLNDVVVAFPPSTAGQLNANSAPDAPMVQCRQRHRVHHQREQRRAGNGKQRCAERSTAGWNRCELVDQPSV